MLFGVSGLLFLLLILTLLCTVSAVGSLRFCGLGCAAARGLPGRAGGGAHRVTQGHTTRGTTLLPGLEPWPRSVRGVRPDHAAALALSTRLVCQGGS